VICVDVGPLYLVLSDNKRDPIVVAVQVILFAFAQKSRNDGFKSGSNVRFQSLTGNHFLVRRGNAAAAGPFRGQEHGMRP
jgi:hypothetical protein